MKIILFCITTCFLSTNSFCQHQQGDLLLEGRVSDSWTSLGLLDNTVFGIYITDNLAVTAGLTILFSKPTLVNQEVASTFGIRSHFREMKLLKNLLFYTNLIYIGNSPHFNGGAAYEDEFFAERFSFNLGFGNRFYVNDWLGLEPRIGLTRIAGEPLLFSSSVNIAYVF